MAHPNFHTPTCFCMLPTAVGSICSDAATFAVPVLRLAWGTVSRLKSDGVNRLGGGESGLAGNGLTYMLVVPQAALGSELRGTK